MRSLQDVQQALIEKQARLIVVQEQLLGRLRKFGAEGASSLHHEVGDIHIAIELLERECRKLQPSRPSTCAGLADQPPSRSSGKTFAADPIVT